MKSKLRNFIFVFTIAIIYNGNESLAQGTWLQKANFGGGTREQSIGFSIGNKGYAGTGVSGGLWSDLWEYDPITNIWTQKATMPGGQRHGGIGFSIGNKGYAGLGWLQSGQLSDFYEYNPLTNVWTAKSNFPGGGRYSTVGIEINGKGYVGTGYTPLTNDWWEYDPLTNGWLQKAFFPATVRQAAVGFSVGNFGYLGTGFNNGTHYSDFWKYNPVTNSWTQIANYPGGNQRGAASFTIGSFAYVGMGYNGVSYSNSWYQYDPSNNSWSQVATFGGVARYSCFAFAVNGKGYCGTGSNGGTSNPQFKSDVWEFDFSNLPSASMACSDSVFCDKGYVDFYDMSTNIPTSWQWYFPGGVPSTSNLQNPTQIYYATPGTYDVTLVACNANGCDSLTFPNFINEFPAPTQPTITLVGNVLWSSPASSYQWYDLSQPGVLLSTNPYYTPPQPGSYYVLITDLNGCTSPSAAFVYTAMNELINEDFNVYYNDFTDAFEVTDKGLKGSSILIYDIRGKLIFKKELKGDESNISISSSSFATGIYYLKISNKISEVTFKLFKN